jgi:hypothetical protein
MKCLGEDKKLVCIQNDLKHLKIMEFQFAGGKLEPIETLKLMEKVTQETPEKMERGFRAYSDCSSSGKKNRIF